MTGNIARATAAVSFWLAVFCVMHLGVYWHTVNAWSIGGPARGILALVFALAVLSILAEEFLFRAACRPCPEALQAFNLFWFSGVLALAVLYLGGDLLRWAFPGRILRRPLGAIQLALAVGFLAFMAQRIVLRRKGP
ncbi:MAG: hypothetical protein WC713_09515 [Candidatus Methylomirabilota bacterium]